MKRKLNLNQLALPFDLLGQRSFSSLGRKGGMARALSSVSYDDRVKAFWFLAGACLFALATYVYAVNATAHHVAERAALEREASDLSAEIATLEFKSIALKGDITLELAHQYGFKEVEQPLYVAADKDNSLSFNAQKP